MRSRPTDLSEPALFDVLESNWRLAVTRGEYVAVGGGSHHWRVTEESGRAWWATVDDLTAKAFLGHDRVAAFDGLRRALEAALALRVSGLEFVVAPVRSVSGACLHALEGRYAVAVYPWIEDASYPFSEDLPAAQALTLASMLARLHASPSFGIEVASLQPVELPALENALQHLDKPWTSGPYSERVRTLLSRRFAPLQELLATFDRVALEVSASRPGLVVTHGEPHPANLLRTSDGRLLLVDWDTVSLAPPERDLWWLSPFSLARYCALAEHEVSPAALALYRLRWRLDDVSMFVKRLCSSELTTADTEHAWQALLTYIEPTP